MLTQHLRADSLDHRAVLVAISHTGASNATCLIAEDASQRGITVVGLTSTQRSPLADIADHPIVTGHPVSPHRLDNFASRTNHVAVLSALHTAVAEHHTDSQTNGVNAAKLIARHQR